MFFHIKENFRQRIKSQPYLDQTDVAIQFKGHGFHLKNDHLCVSFDDVKWHIVKDERKTEHSLRCGHRPTRRSASHL